MRSPPRGCSSDRRDVSAADEIRAIAVGQGMTTIAADGIRKAAEGKTSLYEVLRVLPSERD